MPHRPFLLCSLLAAVLSAVPASADEHRLKYRDDWRRFELVDYVSTAAVGAVYLYVEFGVAFPEEPGWTGPVLFDEAVRSALVGDAPAVRNGAALFSDISFYTPLFAPFVEYAVVPLVFDSGNIDVAWQVSAIGLQSAAVSALLTRSGHRFIARARPDVAECEQDPDYDDKCFRGAYAGFPSGHASAAFLGAGLACANHANLPLYGGGAPDIAVCATLATMAVSNGIARIVADRHYASDVLVGMFIGVGAGYAMPVLLHYGGAGSFQTGETAFLVTPFASMGMAGVAASGTF